MVKDLGINSGVDLQKIIGIANWISAILGKKPASRVATALTAKMTRRASKEKVHTFLH